MTQPNDAEHASEPVVLVRLRPEVRVGNTQRVVHMVPLPDLTNGPPESLKAWCGSEIALPDAQVLERFAGMPCERCMAHAPTPEGARLRELMRGERAP